MARCRRREHVRWPCARSLQRLPPLLVLLASAGIARTPPQQQQQQGGTGVALIHIDWERLPDRPVGTQDSVFGVVGGQFVVLAGNRGVPGTAAHKPQGFMWNGGFALALAPGAGSSRERGPPARGWRWRPVPAAPAHVQDGPGQLGFSAGGAGRVVLPGGGGEALAFAGGFSHTNCSREAFLLRPPSGSASAANFTYHRLPSLPWEMAQADVVAVGSTLLIIGGSDCGRPPNTERFLTWSDRWGGNQGLGRRVLRLDLERCPLGAAANAEQACEWERLADFPGWPRAGASTVALNGSVYVLGGVTSANTSNWTTSRPRDCPSISTPDCQANPLDNWRLDTADMSWARLPSNPNGIPQGDTSGVVLWRRRFIISVGVVLRGYGLAWPGGEMRRAAPPGYPRGYQLSDRCSPPLAGWPSNAYSNRINVFDTQTNTFGTVSSSSASEPGLVQPPSPDCPPGLPFNCFSPQAGLVGDALVVTGGECDPHRVRSSRGNESYWHYPAITLRGRLSLGEGVRP